MRRTADRAKRPRGARRKPSSTLVPYIASAFVLTAAMTVLVLAVAIVAVRDFGGEVLPRGLFSGGAVSQAFIVGGAVALVVAALLGFVFATGIAGPIDRISKAAAEVRDGELGARTGLSGDDELALLGETFDEMAASIERDRDLERQLIGDVAHELRTPLMAVQATVEAIQDGVYPVDEEHLALVATETRRLGRLVEALLQLNRLENGASEVCGEPVDLSELIAELVATHGAFAVDAGLTLDSDIAGGVIVDGDADLLLQAASNLLSNAVRYTPEGGSIEVVLARECGEACLSVSDTGVGIAEDDIPRVFSRFWRADAARSRVGGGLGVGLSLVREVADQHNGSVSVESVLGEGSTFTMRLPLSCADRAADADASSARSAERAAEREAKREARAARREEDRARKEEEKLKKLEERERKRTPQPPVP